MISQTLRGCLRRILPLFFVVNCLGIVDSIAQCTLSTDGTDVSCYGASDGEVTVVINGGGEGSGSSNCQVPSPSPESCVSSCISVTDHSDIVAGNGDIYCISTTGYTGNITINTGGKVIVCGDAAKPQGVYFNGGTLIVNSSLMVDTLYYWDPASYFENYGNVYFPIGITLNVSVENHGDITVTGNLTTGDNGFLTNYGTVNGSNYYVNNNHTVNYGTLSFTNTITSTWNKTFTNHCTISAAGLHNRSAFVNSGQITLTGNCFLEGGSYTGSPGSEMTVGGNLTIASPVIGTGTSCSSIRLTGITNTTTTINWGGSFSGQIRLCDPDGVEYNDPSISATYLNCDCEINNNVCTYEWRNSSNVVVGATATVGGLVAGRYTVTVTCSECPNSPLVEYIDVGQTSSMQLALVSSPASCQNNNLGMVALSVSGGTGPYVFNWNNGAYSTQNLTDVPAGKYKVIVTDASLCSKRDSTEIISSGIALSYVKTDATCEGPVGGSIVWTGAGGRAPYTYSWSNGASVRDLFDLEAGVYSVDVTDQDGCQDFVSVTINGTDGPGLIGSVAPESCSSKGAIGLTVSGGIPPYAYFWSNGGITKDIANLEAGEYEVRVTDSRGCMSSHWFEVPADFPFNVDVDYTNSTAYGANDGTATVEADGAGSSGPACPPAATTAENCSNCEPTRTISDDTGPLVVNSGEKMCLTASSFNSSITVNGGELVICGKASPSGFAFYGGSVTITGEFVFPTATHIYNNLTFNNYGTVASGGIELSGTINNHGTFVVNSGNILIYSGGILTNTGEFTITMGRLSSSGTIGNSGPFTIAKGIESQQTGSLFNECTISADSLISHAGFTNYGSITVNVLNIPNPGSIIKLGEVSSIYAQTVTLNGTLENEGNSCALISAETHMTINNGTMASGLISLCNQGTLTNNATGLSTFLNCDCVLSVGSCSVTWSNAMTGNTITGLSPGTYVATIACGSCVVARTVIIREEGLLIINTEHVNEAEYTIVIPGLEAVNGQSGTSESEVVLEPLLPLPGQKGKAMLIISGGEDHSPLEILVEFDHYPAITAVRAKMHNQYMDISPEYYTIQDGNKLYFYNEKPVSEPYIISTNLVKGVKLDPATETLEINMPVTSVFSSVLMSIYKIEATGSVQVVAPNSALVWDASGAGGGLYEFALQLSASGTTRTYKGQFIIGE
jgi:VCBS repeat-containing protein